MCRLMLRMLSLSTGSESLRPRHVLLRYLAKATTRVTVGHLHLCTCVICCCVSTALAYTSAGPLESQAKRCFLHLSSGCALTPQWWRSRFLLISLIHDSQLVRVARQRKTLACFWQWQEEIYLHLSGQFFFVCLWRPGVCIYCGDAARFHEWEFRTRLRIAGKSGDQYIEAMSKVCAGLRGDAFRRGTGNWLR